MSFDYDLFVIGGGSGGVRAARMSSLAGAKTAIAEEYRYGGTCVIRGCVPKKLMMYASTFSELFEDAQGFGWTLHEPPTFDWATFKAHKDAEIARLEVAYAGNLGEAGVEVLRTRAVVTGPHSVKLADGTGVTAKHILIATGGRPFVPDLPGADLAMTSDDVFEMQELPKRMIIVGGGYIACEFAGILNGLGVAVTMVHRGPCVLRGFDRESAEFVENEMAKKGVILRLNAEIESMERAGDGVRATLRNGEVIETDAVVYATGRNPNTPGLGLEEAGVALTWKGAVCVNEYSQTAVPSIHAVGDVTDRLPLTPVAIREGAAFAKTVFGNEPTMPNHELVPTAVFTQPELASCGLTEEEAREAPDRGLEIYKANFKPMFHAMSGRDERMLMKLIVCKDDRKVLGCHLVGLGAAEMIQLVGVALKMGATKEDFDRTVAVHPTAAEELVTMREPAA